MVIAVTIIIARTVIIVRIIVKTVTMITLTSYGMKGCYTCQCRAKRTVPILYHQELLCSAGLLAMARLHSLTERTCPWRTACSLPFPAGAHSHAAAAAAASASDRRRQAEGRRPTLGPATALSTGRPAQCEAKTKVHCVHTNTTCGAA